MENPIRILVNEDEKTLSDIEFLLDVAGVDYEYDNGGRFIIEEDRFDMFECVVHDYDYEVVA